MAGSRDSSIDKRVLLASGLSAARPHSFTRQLDLLRHELVSRGAYVTFVGTGAHERGDVASLTGDVFSHLVAELRLDVAVLLGYRDQFPVLSTGSSSVPTYLWAQVSAVPAGVPPNAIAVPLTGMTGEMLAAAGWQVAKPIPHAVDTAVFSPAQNAHRDGARDAAGCLRCSGPSGGEAEPRPVRFLTVGANTRRKRFDLLVEAFHRVRASRDCVLTIKTDRTKTDAGFDLIRLAEPGVTVDSTERPPSAMAELYRSHDVYVHASEWEGFGVPAAEAMACGLPVVCSGGQGPGELVPYRDLLVETEEGPPDTPETVRWVKVDSLVDKMLIAAENATLRRSLGEAGRRVARSRFDVTTVADGWLSLFG